MQLYYYGTSPIKIDYEVVIDADGSYQFFLMGQQELHVLTVTIQAVSVGATVFPIPKTVNNVPN